MIRCHDIRDLFKKQTPKKPKNQDHSDHVVELDASATPTTLEMEIIPGTGALTTVPHVGDETVRVVALPRAEVSNEFRRDIGFCQKYDIGLYIGKPINDDLKRALLLNPWKPPITYNFPLKLEGKKNRRFKLTWMENRAWLVYSAEKVGGFCKYCVFFAPSGAGVSFQELKTFVTEPLTKYRNAISDLSSHEQRHYHVFAAQKADEYLKATDPQVPQVLTIDRALDKQKRDTVEANRKRIIPIIKTIVFCARNNLPLRGHRDDGMLTVKDLDGNCNLPGQGVFRNLLAFRVDAGDTTLEHHLLQSNKNATMISKTIQNEIIECVGNVVRDTVLDKVKAAKFFSILVDETTDVSTTEQMTICLRYVDVTRCELREDFVEYVTLKSCTGQNIKDVLMEKLHEFGLSVENLRGQGFDGGSNMSGKFKGVQALIINDQPLAIYTHCFSHCLNLVLTKSCDVSQVRNMLGVVGKVASFFCSAKRVEMLKTTIKNSASVHLSKKQKLKSYCETRWIERHDTLNTFLELMPFVVDVLEDLEVAGDGESSTKACTLNAAIKKCTFVIALKVTTALLSFTLPLSEILQKKNLDLTIATSRVSEVLTVFKNYRNMAESKFKQIYDEAQTICNNLGIDLTVPRQAGRQTMRSNVPHKTVEEYFRLTIFLPFLDHLIQDLTDRFGDKLKSILPLQGLIPSHIGRHFDTSIVSAAKLYENDVPNIDQLQTEITLWKARWAGVENKPDNAMDAFAKCDEFSANIKILLQLLLTVPVSTATPERTFSSLRLIKTYLRSTMGEKRLTGLALPSIHKDIPIDPQEVLKLFCLKRPRRMELGDWSKET